MQSVVCIASSSTIAPRLTNFSLVLLVLVLHIILPYLSHTRVTCCRYLPILLNSANHAAVYSHYLLTSLGLQSWWSPYITTMQLAQFTAIFAQSLLSYRVGPTCGSPDFAKVLMIVYMGSMVLLFSNFCVQVSAIPMLSTTCQSFVVIFS